MSADMLAVNQLGAIVYHCESLQFELCINLSLNLDQNVMNIMVFWACRAVNTSVVT